MTRLTLPSCEPRMAHDPTTSDQAEAARLSELARYDLLDTPEDPAFDRITRLTRAIFDVPMATVTLIDGHRQWFKSRQGLVERETPRGPALCNVAIRETAPLVVPDTQQDDRFRDNPFVTGTPHIRFYAGAPLVMTGGAIIGTLCAMDTAPRVFEGRHLAILGDLAGIVCDEIRRRPAPAELAAAGAPASASPFRRVLKAGRISFNGGRSAMDCTVRGLSDTGASVAVISTADVPEQFKLSIPADNWSRSCRVVARRDRQIDIAFA